MKNQSDHLPFCERCGVRRAKNQFCYMCRAAINTAAKKGKEVGPVRISGQEGQCPRCGFHRYLYRGFCETCRTSIRKGRAVRGSSEHYQRLKGRRYEKCPTWNGGRSLHKDGYIWATVREGDAIGMAMLSPSSLRESSYDVQEHRLTMAHQLGRPLDKSERVHHINGDKTDNRIENLKLFSNQSEHFKHIHFNECPHCGKSLRS